MLEKKKRKGIPTETASDVGMDLLGFRVTLARKRRRPRDENEREKKKQSTQKKKRGEKNI